ncbi:MAG: hypothetical protein ACWGQW_01085 [bacterium]
MTTLKASITGLQKLNASLQGMPRTLGGVMNQATLKAVLYVQGQLPPYPSPKNPDSPYVRTNTLWRSLTHLQGSAPMALSRKEQLGTEFHGIIGTNVKYAPYVIDEDEQAWMHVGHWWILQDEVQKAEAGIKAIYRKAVKEWNART